MDDASRKVATSRHWTQSKTERYKSEKMDKILPKFKTARLLRSDDEGKRTYLGWSFWARGICSSWHTPAANALSKTAQASNTEAKSHAPASMVFKPKLLTNVATSCNKLTPRNKVGFRNSTGFRNLRFRNCTLDSETTRRIQKLFPRIQKLFRRIQKLFRWA